MGCTPHWYYKPTNASQADSPGVCTSETIINLKKLDKIHINCDCNYGSIKLPSPILFSFILDKPSGYIFFSELETIHYKKVSESVLKTITFYVEDSSHKEVKFNRETLSFSLQLEKNDFHTFQIF